MSEYICGTDGHEGHWLTGEEIVRCRDCEHCHEHDLSAYYGDHEHDLMFCHLLEPSAFDVEPDGFCKWGKRKEDER